LSKTHDLLDVVSGNRTGKKKWEKAKNKQISFQKEDKSDN
jgi:hypothetical protein